VPGQVEGDQPVFLAELAFKEGIEHLPAARIAVDQQNRKSPVGGLGHRDVAVIGVNETMVDGHGSTRGLSWRVLMRVVHGEVDIGATSREGHVILVIATRTPSAG